MRMNIIPFSEQQVRIDWIGEIIILLSIGLIYFHKVRFVYFLIFVFLLANYSTFCAFNAVYELDYL